MSGADGKPADRHSLRFYGRRHGRALRPGRAALLEKWLPRLAIEPPPLPASLAPVSLFPPPVDTVWLEIGFGAGEHLVAQARRHPNVGVIGCEPFANGVAALIANLAAAPVDNVRLFADDARRLLPGLAQASIGRVFVLFNDPWPKRRHHRRRLITADTLDELARLLHDGGELWFASDHLGYVRWTLALLTAHACFIWPVMGPADWRQPPGDWLPTRYEAKASARGSPCVYLRFVRRPRRPAVADENA